MNNTIGGFTTDREWVLDKNTKEDIVYLDDYAKEHNISRRTRLIGIMDIFRAQKDEQYKKYYNIWLAMLARCYSYLYIEKNPSYEFILINREFHILSKFYHVTSNLYHEDTWQLDKDFSGLNEYSKDSIIFLPQYLNKLFRNASGNLPLFISKNSFGLQAQVRKYNQPTFYKAFPYSKSTSKEIALLKAFTAGIKMKLLEIEKHIDNVILMPNPPQEWKNQVISKLNNSTKKYNILLKDFNPEEYSQYL